jgi:hypothetical protein
MSLEVTSSERFLVDLYLGSAILIKVHRGFTQSLEIDVRDITRFVQDLFLPFETLTSSPFIYYRSLRRYIGTESVVDNQ